LETGSRKKDCPEATRLNVFGRKTGCVNWDEKKVKGGGGGAAETLEETGQANDKNWRDVKVAGLNALQRGNFTLGAYGDSPGVSKRGIEKKEPSSAKERGGRQGACHRIGVTGRKPGGSIIRERV